MKLAQNNAVIVHPKIKRKLFPDQATEKLVLEFYERDEISRQLPGRKDIVVVVENGEKVLKQKKLLLMNVFEVYQMFKKEYPQVKIGKSKFAVLRPQHVCICLEKDHTVCCCVYHENFSLLLEGLRKLNKDITSEMNLIDSSVCLTPSNDCFLGVCSDCCKVQHIVEEKVMEKLPNDIMLEFYQWNKKVEKVLCQA